MSNYQLASDGVRVKVALHIRTWHGWDCRDWYEFPLGAPPEGKSMDCTGEEGAW